MFYRKIVMALLAAGAIGGFASGFATAGRHWHEARQAREQQMMQQFAHACADAVSKQH